MPDADADVVIVGGGPAGGAAAILLARFGYSCLLIERREPGTPKLCGEFLSPDSLPVLRVLSVEEDVRHLVPPVIESVRVVTDRGMCWEGRLPDSGFGITRHSLEGAILARAEALGVRMMLGASVRQISMDADGRWTVEVDRRDGPRVRVSARSILRSTGRDGSKPTPGRARDRYIAYQAHFDGPSLQGRVELHGFRDGYVGLIDVERERRNLCLLAKPSVDSSNRPEAVIARIVRSNPSFASWLDRARRVSEWTSASMTGMRSEHPVSEDGAFSLGDAAGVIAPFSGNGRSMALRSAEILTPILHEHLSGRISLQHAGSTWRRAWRQEFRARTRAASILNGVLMHPPTLAVALRILRAVPPLGDLAISSTRGRLRDGTGACP